MSDVSPYGVTQNPDAAAVTAEQLVGEHAGSVTEHQDDARFSPARFSTAPYQPPTPLPVADMADICKYKNCRQPQRTGFVYCDRHVGGGD